MTPEWTECGGQKTASLHTWSYSCVINSSPQQNATNKSCEGTSVHIPMSLLRYRTWIHSVFIMQCSTNATIEALNIRLAELEARAAATWTPSVCREEAGVAITVLLLIQVAAVVVRFGKCKLST